MLLQRKILTLDPMPSCLPDPELLPLSGKDLPRLLELRRKSYFKIKRTCVRRDVQYARAVGNRKKNVRNY